MLGFSTACSTAKKSEKSNTGEENAQPTEQAVPAIKLMYGVRPPHRTVVAPVSEVEKPEPQSAEAETRNDDAPAETTDSQTAKSE